MTLVCYSCGRETFGCWAEPAPNAPKTYYHCCKECALRFDLRNAVAAVDGDEERYHQTLLHPQDGQYSRQV